MHARAVSGFVTALALIVVAYAVVLAAQAPSGSGPGRAPGGAEERLEQELATDLRLQALRGARADGIFGQRQNVVAAASPGWTGEQLMGAKTDDWEPAVAADPNSGYVYLITTRYGESKPCPGNCPIPHIAIEISSDNGLTWSEGAPLCACKGSGQFDPIIEVVPGPGPAAGHVYALWMNGFNVVFQKSEDHGATWSEPVSTYGNVSWNDKPVIAMSDDGKDVYVSWNGPTGGDPWIAQSHEFGNPGTWTQTKVVDSGRYFFAYDADVTSNGTVVFSESSFDYSGPAASAIGRVDHHAFFSRDRGATWEVQRLGSVELGEPCVSEQCYDDFYAGHNTVTADADGDLVYAFDGATTPLGPQQIFVRRSTDGGRTWSDPTVVSTVGRMATAPAAEATGNDDVRLWFAERRPADRWNIWYRSSIDGGVSWSAPVLISDATSGAKYKNADGFLEFYGDYGEVAVMSNGKTIATWAEGFSWLGPGGTWFNIGA
jgi:BNR repeat-like domain